MSCNQVSIYILERYVRRELNQNYSDKEFVESVQNVIMYIKIGLIDVDDIIFEGIDIREIHKLMLKDGIIVYDINKHPIKSAEFKRSTNNMDITNLKLKRIITT